MAHGVKRDHLGADQTGDPQSLGLYHHVVASRAKLEQKRKRQDRDSQNHELELKLVMLEVTEADGDQDDHHRVVEDQSGPAPDRLELQERIPSPFLLTRLRARGGGAHSAVTVATGSPGPARITAKEDGLSSWDANFEVAVSAP